MFSGIASDPYSSSSPYSSRSSRRWRYRVVDLDIFINGCHSDLLPLKAFLPNKKIFEELLVSYIKSMKTENDSILILCSLDH